MINAAFAKIKLQPAQLSLLRAAIMITGFSCLLLLSFATSGSALAEVCSLYPAPQLRFGFNLDLDDGTTISEYDTSQLAAHWFLDYRHYVSPTVPAGMQFAHTLRAGLWRSGNYTNSLVPAVQANPGALWILGNEPDRHGQDGLLAGEFAAFYHDLYSLIKTADPTSQVAVGAVVQGTPIRLRYLSMVLDEYQARYGQLLPADIWTVHGFILRECNDAGCWGASIPPGLDAFKDEGKLYDIPDHGNIEIFKTQIIAFRQWMATHGYREKPLLVTEYGILFPSYLGYPYETVRDYMQNSFDFFLNTHNTELGYPEDENRLVQAWSWFSLNVPEYDPITKKGFNGNLFDPITKQIRPLGVEFHNYVQSVAITGVDLGIQALKIMSPTQVLATLAPITVVVNLRNLGGELAQEIEVETRLLAPNASEAQLIDTRQFNNLKSGCRDQLQFVVSVQPFINDLGMYTLSVNLRINGQLVEQNLADNQATQSLLIVDQPLTEFLYLPVVGK